MCVSERDEDRRLAAVLVRRALMISAEAELETKVLDALLDALRLLESETDAPPSDEAPASAR
jgi:hypothetical protein